jgi:myo-inositol-1(or 4)-monophosphatase
MHPNINIAIRAARRAGDIILRSADRVDLLRIESKGRQDFVTTVDRDAEAAIIETLHGAYPGDAILAEESGRHGDAARTWIVDPLDGTTNFLHRFPQYAVSIALQENGVLQHAVIFDPTRDELFTASRGRGAQLNNKRIRVSSLEKLNRALIGTGFPVRDLNLVASYTAPFTALLTSCSGIRRGGAAALDLAYVACGRLDGFWEFGLKIWDLAAGILLIQEAGGVACAPDGTDSYLTTGNVVTANPHLCEQLRRTIAPRADAAG